MSKDPGRNHRLKDLQAIMAKASANFDEAGRQLVEKYKAEKRNILAPRFLESLDVLTRPDIRKVIASLLCALDDAPDDAPIMIIDPNQKLILQAVLFGIMDLIAIQDDALRAAVRNGKAVQ